MADIAGIYALGAALGAAGIGAVAGGLVQRAKRKQDVAEAEVQRQQADEERRRLAADLALEVSVTARAAARAWLSSVELVLQDVRLGRTVDIARFDEECKQLQSDLTGAMYRLASVTTAVPQTLAGRIVTVQPYVEQIADVTLLVRSDLYRMISGSPPVNVNRALLDLCRQVGFELDYYVALRIERLLTEDGIRQVAYCRELPSADERRVQDLRSQLAFVRSDEALQKQLQNQLTGVRKRINARPSISDLEASLAEAELTSLGKMREILSRAQELDQYPRDEAFQDLIRGVLREGYDYTEIAELLFPRVAEQEGFPGSKARPNPADEN